MDDYSPPPIAPGLEFVEQDAPDTQALAHDQRIAKSYFHPAWDGVQQLFEDKIASLQLGTTNTQLLAEEYKIEDQVCKRTAGQLKEILIQVQNAVSATEGNKGGK